MKFKDLIILFVAIIGITLSAVAFVSRETPATPKTGSSDIGILPTNPRISNVWVGTSDTVVVATSTGRLRLEISNISGATSTAQALYCNTDDRPSVAYAGIVIQASSTKIYELTQLPRGALRCRYPVSASSVAVIEY